MTMFKETPEAKALREEYARQYEAGEKLFFDMIKERPDTEHGVRNLPPCPYCGSPKWIEGDHGLCQTCMGNIGVDTKKYPEQDCNNKTRSITCPDCDKAFCVESKYDNVWITAEHRDHMNPDDRMVMVLQGLPSLAHRNYVFHCAKCKDGLVHHEYYHKDKDEPLGHRCLSHIPDKGGAQYRSSFYCDKCEARIITNFDSWYCGPPPLNLTPEEAEYKRKVGEALMNGTLFQGPGRVIGNVAGIERVDFT